MKTLLAFLLLSSLTLSARAESDKFKIIHVADLAAELKSSRPPTVCDANNDDTRQKYGVIPGAILLASSKKFDTKILPADKTTPLVFYCANTMCMASHQAAKRAIKSGYNDVSVMADGISGWAKAGQPTDKVPAAKAPAASAKS